MVKASRNFDRGFLISSLLLLGVGLAVLNSAQVVESLANFETTRYYFIHQLIYGAGIGLVAMWVVSKFEYRKWQRLIPLLVVVSLLLLMLVKVPGISFSSGGATRWIHFGPIFFQPAELAKLTVVLYIAGWITQRKNHIKNFYYGLLPALFILGLYALLILWQPDVGTMSVIVLTALTMLYLGGTKLRHFAGIIVGGLAFMLVIIKLEPYRLRRLTTFLNPGIDPLGIGYQINQALIAIGSGGWFGYGYNASRQKYNYLPEAIGDSIFAIMAEELGFFRVLVVLGLFGFFIYKGIKIGLRAPDMFGKMLALGLTLLIAFQVVINIGAIIGILPLTGITLPFFSYGSSSLIMVLVEVGILLNISKHTTYS